MINRFEYETTLYNRGAGLVIGVDEVGRGPLAGPVVAAAVAFVKPVSESWWEEIKDSKKLSALKREALAESILNNAQTGIGQAEVSEIENLNILQASLLAMKRAVMALGVSLENAHVVVDGKFLIPELYAKEQQAFVKGDGLVHSIAAASILAKVTRDRLMKVYAQTFPMYGFDAHKGYGTSAHILAIKQHGLSAIHCPSFCGNIL